MICTSGGLLLSAAGEDHKHEFGITTSSPDDLETVTRVTCHHLYLYASSWLSLDDSDSFGLPLGLPLADCSRDGVPYSAMVDEKRAEY